MIAMIGTNGRRPARGFSLLELMIVVGITLVVAAIAIPGVFTATQNFKLRSTASSASGLIQKARMLSVARNTYYPVLSSTDTTTNITTIFLGNANDFTGTTTLSTATDKTSMIQVRGMVFDTSSNPSATSIVGTTLTPVSTLPIFNPRGSPCFGSPCQADATKMYITFLRQDRSIGAPGWAAINVTPAGRVQVWTWNGSQWR